jgi:trimethylamine--corrinoid protein Co-methyltransferase
MLCGAGLMAVATIFSYEQLLKDCEIYDMLRLVTQGISVTNETLALDEFRSAGSQNHFMTTAHTLRHMHDIWQPNIKGRRNPDLSTETEKSPSEIIAGEKAREILQTHSPKPLPNADTVREILEHYDRLATEE